MKRNILYGCFFALLGLILSSAVYAQEEEIAWEEPNAVLFYNPNTGEEKIVDIDNSSDTVEDFDPFNDDYSHDNTDDNNHKMLGANPENKVIPVSADKYKRIVYLLISLKDGKFVSCSGAMIGPKAVLTAGHCLNNGISITQIVAYAGGSNSSLHATATDFVYASIDIQHITDLKDMLYDWAYIILDEPLGNKTGYFGAKNPTLYKGNKISTIGFPFSLSSEHPWLSKGRVVLTPIDDTVDKIIPYLGIGSIIFNKAAKLVPIKNGLFEHTAWTEPALSGSPIFLENDFSHIIAVSSVEVTNKKGQWKCSIASGLGTMNTIVKEARKYKRK